MNDKMTRRKHVLTIGAGIIITFVTLIIYNYYYDHYMEKITIHTFEVLALLALGISFGAALILINFTKKINVCIGLILVGVAIERVLVDEKMRWGIGVLFFTYFLALLFLSFINVLSTIITYICTLYIFLIVSILMTKCVPTIPQTLVLYVALSLHLLIYSICGVKINRWYIGFMGFPVKAEEYDYEQLKNQILLLYLLLFVYLNVMLYIGKMNEEICSLMNNIFLTGVAIIQINWMTVYKFSKHKEEENNSDNSLDTDL